MGQNVPKHPNCPKALQGSKSPKVPYRSDERAEIKGPQSSACQKPKRPQTVPDVLYVNQFDYCRAFRVYMQKKRLYAHCEHNKDYVHFLSA